MADSLDDFFAKKDKKRGKDKSKVAALSAEALVRELEEGAKQNDYPVRKEKTSAAIEILGLDSNDSDWKDFEEVERRDYTGLKVKEMSLQDQTDDEQRRLEQAEPVPESTPWSRKEETKTSEATSAKQEDTSKSVTKSDTSATVSSTDQNDGTTKTDAEKKNDASSTDAPAKEGDSKKPSAKQAYVPPQQRLGEVRQLEPVKLSQLKSSSSRQGATIDITNTNQFPSLG